MCNGCSGLMRPFERKEGGSSSDEGGGVAGRCRFNMSLLSDVVTVDVGRGVGNTGVVGVHVHESGVDDLCHLHTVLSRHPLSPRLPATLWLTWTSLRPWGYLASARPPKNGTLIHLASTWRKDRMSPLVAIPDSFRPYLVLTIRLSSTGKTDS